jgi:pimeloyl-ACP methyl ester carboxylesterase
MSKRRIPDEVLDGWLRPLTTDPAIRRDLIRYIAAVDPGELLAAAEAMPNFDRPVLVAWAAEDRIMPIEHGRRLAALFPRGRFVAVKDCYTLIPEDQPVRLAGLIRDFVAGDVHA